MSERGGSVLLLETRSCLTPGDKVQVSERGGWSCLTPGDKVQVSGPALLLERWSCLTPGDKVQVSERGGPALLLETRSYSWRQGPGE